MAEKLKPCPFCGGEACLMDSMGWPHWVWCNECGARVQSTKFAEEGDAEAIAKWNRRAEAEAHLYTLDELIQLKPLTVVYIQECDDPEEACHVTEWIGQKQVEAGNHAGVEPYTQMLFTHFVEAKEEYGDYWRCWSARPTIEQRERVRWLWQN